MNLKPHEIYRRYHEAVFRLDVRTAEGDCVTGTAFHIGGGCLATARHNVEAGTLERVGNDIQELTVGRIHVGGDSRIDLAVIETNLEHQHCSINVGGHLDDWIDDSFVLTKAVLMGYPRIALTRHSFLVGIEVEVNAVVDRYDVPYAHFIVSAVPRGGFSGGPVFGEWGFLIGVMTASLFDGATPSELGFAAVLSVEPLLELVHATSAPCGETLIFANDLFQGRSKG